MAISTLKLQIERVEGRREQQTSWVVVHDLSLLVCLQSKLRLVLTGDMPPHCVVSCECARAERTRNSNSLMALPNVGS